MSIAMIQAFKRTGLKPTERLVAYMLADHHNEGTGRCDPSVSLLVEETGLDARSVSRAISRMAEAGHITVTPHIGSRNTYLLHPKEASEEVTHPRHSAPPPPAESHPRQRVTPGTAPGLPPAESRGDPRHSAGTPPAESPPNRNKPEENQKSNRKGAETLFPEILPNPDLVLLDPKLPQDLHGAWAEWQAYRQERAKAKGAQKLIWTERAAKATAKQIADYSRTFGARMICDRITSAIAGNWQGLNLDKLTAAKDAGTSRSPSKFLY